MFFLRTPGTAVFRDRVQSFYLHALLSDFCAITTRYKRASVRDSECSGLGNAEEASVMFERYQNSGSLCHNFFSSNSACVRKQRGEREELCIGLGLTTVCT